MLALLRFKIALFFACGSFILLIVQGVLFIGLEYRSDIRRTDAEIAEDAQRIAQAIDSIETMNREMLNPIDQNSIRIFDASGNPQFIGLIFQGQEGILQNESWFLEYGDEHHRILTFPIYVNGSTEGFLQVGKEIRTFPDRVSQAMIALLTLSVFLSLFIFFIGILFEKKVMFSAQQSMTHMEQFAQNAGHELRAPLANMQSSLEVAQQSGEYKQGFDELRVELTKMIQLVERILELEGLDESVLEKIPVNLSILAEEISQNFLETFRKKGIRIFSSVEPDVIRMADPDLLRTVLNSLVQNAGKFTPDGGEVSIIVTHQYIEVRDTGIGMSSDVAERIFERFFKADISRSNEGFGLGLSLVKRVIDAHKWHITVISKPGEGSVFRLKFPKK